MTASRIFPSRPCRACGERTLKIGSAGKIFSLTGWKVGWVMGPRELARVVQNAHQFLTFTTSPALQTGWRMA